MAFSKDLRWRAIVLSFVYNIDMSQIAFLLGVSVHSIIRWYQSFQKHENLSV
ncbi:hypothetical protein PHMEG_00022625 [Phytophthora megakarya]|uniref:Transposase n=1 Tax=Phytophthora megakarya TaxID=4795 RepID=A0A225VI72_9STRA|nr:hypothetical protein PHMEG_00022625 [Phytophthora megakarya]